MLVGASATLSYSIAGHAPSLKAIVSTFTFTSIYTGSFVFGSSWTLCVEVAFVALIIPVVAILRRVRTRAARVIIASVIALGAHFAVATLLWLSNGRGELKLAPIDNLLPLLAGYAVATLSPPHLPRIWRIAAIAVACAVWLPTMVTSVGGWFILFATIGSTVVVGTLWRTGSPLSPLGKYSYGVYLWHLPLVELCLFSFGMHSFTIPQGLLFMFAIAVATQAIAIASYRSFEVRFTKVVRREIKLSTVPGPTR
jgi:peptidoglycan/LPS O-acetylase OafA/YrhL